MVEILPDFEDIIDLDALEDSIPEDSSSIRAITMILYVQYIYGRIHSYADLVTLMVWFGLLPEILPLERKVSTELVLAIVKIKAAKENRGQTRWDYLMGSLIIADEIGRVFTLNDQVEILKKL